MPHHRDAADDGDDLRRRDIVVEHAHTVPWRCRGLLGDVERSANDTILPLLVSHRTASSLSVLLHLAAGLSLTSHSL